MASQMDQKTPYKKLEERVAELEDISKKKHDLELIYKSVTNSVIVLDPDQNILSVNPAAERLIGAPESELLNKKCHEVLHSEKGGTRPDLCLFQQIFSGEVLKNMEAEIELEKGHFLVSCTPVFDEAGKLDSILHVSTDITSLKNNEKKSSMLLEATRTIPLSKNFNEAARNIYDICKTHIGAACGYVAMKSENKKDNDLLFLDDGGLPCFVDPSLPMPIRGLRKHAYDTGEVAYSNDFMNSSHKKHMPKGHMDLHNVLFSPLKFGEDVAGVIGLANKPDGFNENDIEIAKAFGEVAALALKHSTIKEDLVQREQFSSRLLTQSPNPILVINNKKEVTYANRSFEILTGFSLEETIGMKPPYPWWTKDDLEKTRTDLDKAINSGALSMEKKFRHKSGKIFYVEITSTPVLKKGVLDYYLANWVDVTDKKKAEKTLKETQDMFLKSFKNAPVMITISTIEDGRYLEVNDAFIKSSGFSREQAVGRTSVELGFIKHKDREHLKNAIRHGGRFRHVELTLTKQNDSPMTCLYSGEIIVVNGVKRLLSTAIDITDRKQQEDLLQQKQSELEVHSKKLEAMNTALNVLIEHRNEEKETFKMNILKHFEKLVFPYFPTSTGTGTEQGLSAILSILERNIKEILLKEDNKNFSLYTGLTPMESQIAYMIKQEKSSKEIAGSLNLSLRTVYFHRENIRKKLNLRKTKASLKFHLQSKI
jgi:PAS domain S-box-containing protein